MKYVFIVEGTRDKIQVKRALANYGEFGFIVLHGTHFGNAVRRIIDYNLYTKMREVFILTDPDDTGNLIAQRIQEIYPIKRIMIDRNKAKCLFGDRWRYGVEYCEEEYLREVFRTYNII
jgi:ribonuclease M5